MNGFGMKDALENIARAGVPEKINLWPKIEARLNERKSFMTTLRARPLLAILFVLLIVLLLTGAVYAFGLLTGYIPGIGFVQTNNLRVLAGPVSQTRQGVTVTIEQVTVDPDRTIIMYKTEGLTIAAANSKGEGAPFGAPTSLRLPDGTNLEVSADNGYGGTPEPLVNDIHTEGGWPNYVGRLVYPSVPADVNQLTLLIPILQTMPSGAAPENWEIIFHLKPAPPDMTFAPITELAEASTPRQTESTGSSSAGETSTPALSNTATLHGFTFKLDNVIELNDGFVFTGSLSWDDSAFPTGKGMLAEAAIPILTDESGQKIPIEEVQVNGTYDEHHRPWSYRTDRKTFAGPLTLSISSIQTSVTEPAVDFAIDFGSNPQIGQTLEINHDFVVDGHTVRLLSVSLGPVPSTCQGGAIDFNFRGDVPGMGAYLSDVLPVTPMVCSPGGGGGGGGGPVDPNVFSTGITYRDIPSGVHHFSMNMVVPYEVQGPWQVTWNPPMASVPTPTSEPEACLTDEKWQQLIAHNDPLPPELAQLGGHILVSVDAGPVPTSNFPLLQISNLDGSGRRDLVNGGWSALSPDGSRLFYDDEKGLHLLDVSTGKITSPGFDGSVPVWSPDGVRIMYTTFSNLYVSQADGSRPQKVDTGGAQMVNSIGFLPDNQTIVYSVYGEGFTFWMQNLQSGETKKLFTVISKAGLGVLSPDGGWIAFSDRMFGGNGPGIFVSRLDGSERRLLVSSDVPAAFEPAWSPDGKWLLVNTSIYSQANQTSVYRPVAIELATCRVIALPPTLGDVINWGR